MIEKNTLLLVDSKSKLFKNLKSNMINNGFFVLFKKIIFE